MPTYSYECTKCAHVFDLFHAMSATPKVKCESCGARCQRLIGTGAGIIFKGSGFYETDYKDKKGKPPAKDATTVSKTGGDSDGGKKDSAGKSESAPKSESTPKKDAKKAV